MRTVCSGGGLVGKGGIGVLQPATVKADNRINIPPKPRCKFGTLSFTPNPPPTIADQVQRTFQRALHLIRFALDSPLRTHYTPGYYNIK
jgi:hypothetical protein